MPTISSEYLDDSSFVWKMKAQDDHRQQVS